MTNTPQHADTSNNPSVAIAQEGNGRAAARDYIETLNFLGTERRIPECVLRNWVTANASVPAQYHDPQKCTAVVSALEYQRVVALYVQAEHSRLYHGLIEAAAFKIGMHDSCVQASYHTEAMDEFKGDVSLTLATLLRSLPETANNKLIVVNLIELAPLHQSLIDSLHAHSHPSTMERLTRNLADRGVYMLFAIDRSTPVRDIKIGTALVAIEPLEAVKAEILGNHKASDIDLARLDRVISSELLGSDSWRNAAELHDKFASGTLLSMLRYVEDHIKSGNPRGLWGEQIRKKLFPSIGTSVFNNIDSTETKHNAAIVESGRISLFVFSLLESCSLSEFEEIFRTIVSTSDRIERVEVESHYEDRPSETGPVSVERKVAKRISTSILEENKKNRDGIFRELSIRYSAQSGSYSFSLPFMKDAAAELLQEELPVTSHEWFNRLVFDTPTMFTSSDDVARQLMNAYADWLSARSGEATQDFSVLSWWRLASHITQLGYEKAIEGIEDKNLLLLVGFLSERAAIHVFVARACMFFQTLMSRPSLEHLVEQALNDLINNRGWNVALGICRTLHTHPRFDAFRWIIQIVDRGDTNARDAAGSLLVRVVESASDDHKQLDALLKRMRSHVPADGTLKRPSERIVRTIVQRLVFGRSARGNRWSMPQNGVLLPFFRVESSSSVVPLTSGAGLLDLYFAEIEWDALVAEVKATCEAAKSMWFERVNPQPGKAEQFSKVILTAIGRSSSVRSVKELQGIMTALVVIEAFATLRRIGGATRQACIEGERNVMANLSRALDSNGRSGLFAGAAAAASTLAGIDQLQDQHEIAERLEKWAQR